MNPAAEHPGLPADLRVSEAEGIITLCDANTTVGYCRHSGDGEIEYLFVQSMHRRRGIALALLHRVQCATGTALRFRGPLSPSGEALVAAYTGSATAGPGES